MITMIVALDRNGAIGRAGQLLYHIRPDLQRFKELTTGHTVVMGRRTFESLPKGALPNRRNIVLTTQSEYNAPGIETAADVQAVLDMTAGEPEVFVIGGQEVYHHFLPVAHRLEVTLVDAETDGADTFFPDLDSDGTDWLAVRTSTRTVDPATGLGYVFLTLERAE